MMYNFNEIWKKQLNEQEFDPSKLKINDRLSEKFWQRGRLNEDATLKLLEIAQDFYSMLKAEVPSTPELEDVTFTGSLASYNYHNLSDIDLHLLLDFGKFEENPEILEKFFTAKRIQWNKAHKIMIFGHEVEIYIQDVNEEHFANGVYSILKQDWMEMPTKDAVDIDYEGTRKKYVAISKEIEELSDMFKQKKYKEVHDYASLLKNKIKRMRQSGLEEEGTYSSENLAFKMLRINKDLEILSNLKIMSYDKTMSLPQDSEVRINFAENWQKFLENNI